MLDALRFIAAVAIVWEHTPESPLLRPYTALSTFAVPFFVLSAMLLVFDGVRRNPGRPVGRYISNRFARIYVPFLIWSAIYLLAREGKHILLTHRGAFAFEPTFLIYGTAAHLWFLPFILVVTIAGFLAARAVITRPTMLRAAAILALVGGIVIGFMPINLFASNFFLDRSWNMSPSALWGFAIGALFPAIPASFWRARWLTPIGLILCIGGSALAMTRYRTILTDNLAGVGLLMVALQRRSESASLVRIASLGAIAYGVYLIHELFIEGFQAIAARKGVVAVPWLDVSVFIASLACSTLAAMFLAKKRWARWLVP